MTPLGRRSFWSSTVQRKCENPSLPPVNQQKLTWQDFGKDRSFWWDHLTSVEIKDLKNDHKMNRQNISISRDGIYLLLQECNKSKDLAAITHAHCLMMRTGLDLVTVLNDQLIHLYAECGSLPEANHVFQNVPIPTIYTWNAIISSHVKLGKSQKALNLFLKMNLQGIKPDAVTFSCVLKACSEIGNVQQGMLTHNQILRSDHVSSVIVGNSLLDMYARCGDLESSRKVFEQLINKNIISWGAMLTGYAIHDLPVSTLELYSRMKDEGIASSKVIILCALKACASLAALEKGNLIHTEIIQKGLESDDVIGSTIVDMYAKCGSLNAACSVFHSLSSQDEVSWTTIIAGCAEHEGGLALSYFKQLQQDGLKPGKMACLFALKACASIGELRQGMLLHEQLLRWAYDSDVIVGSALVDMYSKCESLEDARCVFEKLTHRDEVLWGAMIEGYARHMHGYAALDLFKRMQSESLKPCKGTFLSTLKACSSIGNLVLGRLVHTELVKANLDSDSALQNTLVDMYAKCGSLKEAQKVFDGIQRRNVVSWGAMVSGYAGQGHALFALNIFEAAQQQELVANTVIYLSALKSCAIIPSIELGRLIHNQLCQFGDLIDVVVGNTLIDMYVKCRSLNDAHKVFDILPTRDLVSWGTLMSGYVNQGFALPVFELFEKMQEEGIKPDEVTLLCSLKACYILGALVWGRRIHGAICASGFELNDVLESHLVNVYAKSGSIEEARKVFDCLSNPDVASWGALIAGYALNGDFKSIQQCLACMKEHGVKPSGVIFTSILAACTHAGLLEEGSLYFQSMIKDHAIVPSLEHYGCMADLFGRAGRLTDAEDFLRSMSNSPDIITWRSLLANCRTYSNMDLAKGCLEEVVQLDPYSASGYSLFSNIYTNASGQEDTETSCQLTKFAGVQKQPGMAWIEVYNNVHEFIVGDNFNDQIVLLKRIIRVEKHEGHVPQLNLAAQLDTLL